MRMTVLPLILESDTIQENLASSMAGTSNLDASTSTPATDGPPAYVSLLTERYTPPPILSRPNGLPSNPILAVPPPNTPKGDFNLTPDTLRYLGTIVERFTGQSREVLLAAQTADMRAQLQRREFARQQAKARELLQRVDALKGARQAATRAKLEAVRDAQKALMARVDKILGAMMRNASPEVSEHERKWFEELKRMRDEVVGRGRYDQESLAARTSLVSQPYLCNTQIMPNYGAASSGAGSATAQLEGVVPERGEAEEEDACGRSDRARCFAGVRARRACQHRVRLAIFGISPHSLTPMQTRENWLYREGNTDPGEQIGCDLGEAARVTGAW